MLPLVILTPDDAARTVALRCRALRLHHNLTQAALASSAGISTASLKRFERTGHIAFVSMLRIAMTLGASSPLDAWFSIPEHRSIDEAIARAARPVRQRGRRK